MQNALSRTWGIFADALGDGYRLADLMLEENCVEVVGNPWCDTEPMGPRGIPLSARSASRASPTRLLARSLSLLRSMRLAF